MVWKILHISQGLSENRVPLDLLVIMFPAKQLPNLEVNTLCQFIIAVENHHVEWENPI